jgi:hypothetical protein
VESGLVSGIYDRCPKLMREVIEQCWARAPEERPTMHAVQASLTTGVSSGGASAHGSTPTSAQSGLGSARRSTRTSADPWGLAAVSGSTPMQAVLAMHSTAWKCGAPADEAAEKLTPGKEEGDAVTQAGRSEKQIEPRVQDFYSQGLSSNGGAETTVLRTKGGGRSSGGGTAGTQAVAQGPGAAGVLQSLSKP